MLFELQRWNQEDKGANGVQPAPNRPQSHINNLIMYDKQTNSTEWYSQQF